MIESTILSITSYNIFDMESTFHFLLTATPLSPCGLLMANVLGGPFIFALKSKNDSVCHSNTGAYARVSTYPDGICFIHTINCITF